MGIIQIFNFIQGKRLMSKITLNNQYEEEIIKDFISSLLEIMKEKITVEEIADPSFPPNYYLKHTFLRLLLKSGIGNMEEFGISFLKWMDGTITLTENQFTNHEILKIFLQNYAKALSQIIMEYSNLKHQNEIKLKMFCHVQHELEILKANDLSTQKEILHSKEALAKAGKNGDLVIADLMFLIDKLNRDIGQSQ